MGAKVLECDSARPLSAAERERSSSSAWFSPPSRIRWAVVLLSLLAAALYAWGATRGATHPYYTAAIRTMSESWHAFVFGAFDPTGFVTTDKLPGSMWVHALFVRVFGMHTWVLLLPEVLAATASVPLLFGAVRRWSGVRAGLVAAVILMLTPAVLATTRVNLPDTLLLFFVVAAAYALVRALEHPGWRWLVLSAVLVGLAFQMKMLQAFLVLPAFCLTYLFFAAVSPRARLVRAVVYGALSLLVSVAWMAVVSLVPATSRPQVDGSTSNSLWDMVFVYNGVGRGGSGNATAGLFGGQPGITRLFNAELATQISWLLPLAVLFLVAGVIGTSTARGGDRIDRAGWTLWGGWLVVGWAALSVLSGMHPYYTTMVAPPLAALVGTGVVRAYAAWQARRPAGWLLPAGVLLTAGWALVLLLRQSVSQPWLLLLVALATAMAVGLLLAVRVTRVRSRELAAATALVLGVALFAAPGAWALSTPAIADTSPRKIDPLAGPEGHKPLLGRLGGVDRGLLGYLEANRGDARFLFASAEASTAAHYLGDGLPVLPLRGFTEESPSIPVGGLSRLVGGGEVRYVLMGSPRPGTTGSAREREAWVRENCALVPREAYGKRGAPESPWGEAALYDCRA
ncbi:glycosyltransferase family 39 protein [Amycolatopsis nigrescens]|uniref:glycosyltransferase family 39 protein n=1 Tax=Amycolatopsis nigrescens TaxID=381445 RepID=UPI00035EAC1A|nr:glycosyltransferase family 39 protein [Amycolatopsis nigrescens]